MNKNYAKTVQTFEQAGSMMEQFAYMMWQYFAQLVERGFTRTEALALCRSYQTVIVKSAFLSNEQSPVKDEDEE